MENSIKITGLTKRFGSKVALDSIDLDIPQGMSGLLASPWKRTGKYEISSAICHRTFLCTPT